VPRTYEAVYIFDSTLEDAAINEKINRFHGMLRATEQPEVAHWGRRQLAYSIGPRENGYYVVSKFSTEPTTRTIARSDASSPTRGRFFPRD